jgi:hypothetical protein
MSPLRSIAMIIACIAPTSAMAQEAQRVLVAGFDVNGADACADASVASRASTAIAQGLLDYDVVVKHCTPRPTCVKNVALASGAAFAVHGSIDVDRDGIRVTVDVIEVQAGRRFAKRVALADSLDDAPLVARDVTLALLTDPTSGFTPHIVAGTLTVLGGATAFTMGLAGLMWINSVRDNPAATARERADAEKIDMPTSIIGAAGLFAVIIGAGIIVGGNALEE